LSSVKGKTKQMQGLPEALQRLLDIEQDRPESAGAGPLDVALLRTSAWAGPVTPAPPASCRLE
jgi:hypothetical protein